MKMKVLGLLIGISASLSYAGCTVTGYVGHLSYLMKGGFTYGIEAGIYTNVGGTQIGIFRAVNTNGTGAVLGDLDDKKDMKGAKLQLEKAFNDWSKVYFNATSGSSGYCIGKTGEEFLISIIH